MSELNSPEYYRARERLLATMAINPGIAGIHRRLASGHGEPIRQASPEPRVRQRLPVSA